MAIKIGKAKEGLHIFNLIRSRPFFDNLNLVLEHCKSSGKQYKTKVLHYISIKCILASFNTKFMFLETSEDLLDQLTMLVHAISID